MTLFADLHRHLGGSVVPRVLWNFLGKTQSPTYSEYPSYEDFHSHYTSKKETLEEFLEVHKMVEKVQTMNYLPYFVKRLVRGAYTFENISYLELRYTPYLRTDRRLNEEERIDQMWAVVDTVAASSRQEEYPVVMPQIVCLHTSLPYHVNKEMLRVAQYHQDVCAVDVAGSDKAFMENKSDFIKLFEAAKEKNIKTTGHLYETKNGCDPDLLPFLDRIGHGIQIPIHHPELLVSVAQRGQCLEVCPTSYLKTGTLGSVSELKKVFDLCFESNVDIAICTDNAGIHGVSLPAEYENLLTESVIDFDQLEECQRNAFKHAFAWPHERSPIETLKQEFTLRNRG